MASFGSAEIGLLSATGLLRDLRAIETPPLPYLSKNTLGIVMMVRTGSFCMHDDMSWSRGRDGQLQYHCQRLSSAHSNFVMAIVC